MLLTKKKWFTKQILEYLDNYSEILKTEAALIINKSLEMVSD
jgi:hypothetical protein